MPLFKRRSHRCHRNRNEHFSAGVPLESLIEPFFFHEASDRRTSAGSPIPLPAALSLRNSGTSITGLCSPYLGDLNGFSSLNPSSSLTAFSSEVLALFTADPLWPAMGKKVLSLQRGAPCTVTVCPPNLNPSFSSSRLLNTLAHSFSLFRLHVSLSTFPMLVAHMQTYTLCCSYFFPPLGSTSLLCQTTSTCLVFSHSAAYLAIARPLALSTGVFHVQPCEI